MISWILIHTKENIADRCVSSLGKVSPLRYLEPTKYITRFIPNGIYFLTLWYSNFLSVLSTYKQVFPAFSTYSGDFLIIIT